MCQALALDLDQDCGLDKDRGREAADGSPACGHPFDLERTVGETREKTALGGCREGPSKAVISAHVYDGRKYVGVAEVWLLACFILALAVPGSMALTPAPGSPTAYR